MEIKVSVTDEHIKKGVCGDAFECALSLALKEQFPEKTHEVVVGSHWIHIYEGGSQTRLECQTPWDVRIFIFDFDVHRPVHAQEFNLTFEKVT